MRKDGYDHGRYAANAGDVWKHFILSEAADYLFCRNTRLNYLESHAGRPGYLLGSPGQWQGGIGACWSRLPSLRSFAYYDILADMNPDGLRTYPGSIRLVMEIAERHGLDLDALAWDTDPGVVSDWACVPGPEIHLGDGFSGAGSALGWLYPGLILIDPPYLDEGDMMNACHLMRRARKSGWTVLLWLMDDGEIDHALGDMFEMHTLMFSAAGMDCGRWQGATVAFHSPDRCLAEHLRCRSAEFREIMAPG